LGPDAKNRLETTGASVPAPVISGRDGGLAPHHKGRSFSFMKDMHRFKVGGNLFSFRQGTKDEDAFLHLRFHAPQEGIKVRFAGHYSPIWKTSHKTP
jgi:hypothetical protein